MTTKPAPPEDDPVEAAKEARFWALIAEAEASYVQMLPERASGTASDRS